MKERIINIIRELRLERRMTQEDLAVEVGVSRQSIISIEKGFYIPSLPLALKISKFFNRPVDEIFRLEG